MQNVLAAVFTRSSAVEERPRNALCCRKFC